MKHLPMVYDDTELIEIAELMIKYKTTFLPRAKHKKESNCSGIIHLKDIISKFNEIKQEYIVKIGD